MKSKLAMNRNLALTELLLFKKRISELEEMKVNLAQQKAELTKYNKMTKEVKEKLDIIDLYNRAYTSQLDGIKQGAMSLLAYLSLFELQQQNENKRKEGKMEKWKIKKKKDTNRLRVEMKEEMKSKNGEQESMYLPYI